MPNTVDDALKDPVPVLIQDPQVPDAWQLAVVHEWRWINQSAGRWEGRVTFGIGGASVKQWVPGTRLRRVTDDWCGEPLPRASRE